MEDEEETGLSTVSFSKISNDHFAGYVVDDSDLEYSDCSSSEDEQLSTSHKTMKDNSKGTHSKTLLSPHQPISTTTITTSLLDEGESEDEFEREMEEEAKLMVSKLLDPPKYSLSLSHDLEEGEEERRKRDSDTTDASTVGTKEKEDLFYDQIYFDSSSEEEERSSVLEKKTQKKRNKVRKLTNDELLYDPNLDDEDEKWVQRQRRAYHNVKGDKKKKSTDRSIKGGGTKGKEGGASEGGPSTDAVLNCPACLSTLCLDCQRHDIYQNQYRAMFVLNCTIIKNEILHYKPKPDRRKRSKGEDTCPPHDTTPTTTRPLNDDTSPNTHLLTTNSEQYHPVKCTVCNTEVAVLDSDQVFHFFNVLASPP